MLLLEQIPLPNGDSYGRWKADDALDVVLHCIRQHDPHRQGLGARLMSLVNMIHDS